MASNPFNQPGFTSFMIDDILSGTHLGEKRHSIKESIITPSHGQMDTNEDLLPDRRIQIHEDSFLAPSKNKLSSSSSSCSISPSSGGLSQSSFRSDSFPSSPSSISGYWIPPTHTLGERINKSLPSSITQASLHVSNRGEGETRTKNQMMDAKVNGEKKKISSLELLLFWPFFSLLSRRLSLFFPFASSDTFSVSLSSNEYWISVILIWNPINNFDTMKRIKEEEWDGVIQWFKHYSGTICSFVGRKCFRVVRQGKVVR